ncbi:MAG TPA: hypothetical protein VMS17_18805 [Gemmataceae bacterium]|nr:hypothetical protein [Gemmataceae bacterium]
MKRTHGRAVSTGHITKRDYTMRWSIGLAFLFAVGCESGPNPDAVAAEKYVRSCYSNVEIVRIETEAPEYAAVSKIVDGSRTKPLDKPAACAVRVRFTWQEENRTTHDDWVVWVTSEHKAIAWTGNANRDQWRPYVQSCANK